MQQSVRTNRHPRRQSQAWQPNIPLLPSPNVYNPTDFELRGFLRCRNGPPPGIQDVLFYITARFADGHFHPLAIVSQVPPAASRWPPTSKAFVARAARRIHRYLSEPFRHALLDGEVQRAALLYSGQGGARPLAPAEPPGVAASEDRAIWLDNPPHRHCARALLHCLADGEGSEEEYWTPLELRRRFAMQDCRFRAVVFDITDLARVRCGVVENDLTIAVDATQNPPQAVEEWRRTVLTVPQWVATPNEFERSWMEGRDGSADLLMRTFPDIPTIDKNILQMLWTTDEN